MKYSCLFIGASLCVLAFGSVTACSKDEGPGRLVIDDAGTADAESDASDGAIQAALPDCVDRGSDLAQVTVCKDVSTALGKNVPNSVVCLDDKARAKAILLNCITGFVDAGVADDAAPPLDAGPPAASQFCCPADVRGGKLSL